jgi:hypothetical protein
MYKDESGKAEKVEMYYTMKTSKKPFGHTQQINVKTSTQQTDENTAKICIFITQSLILLTSQR